MNIRGVFIFVILVPLLFSDIVILFVRRDVSKAL